MKRLNKKGFTLIELLAVIVILAVVMVVTIPSVLNSMASARQKQLENAVHSIEEYVQKNYDICASKLNSEFSDLNYDGSILGTDCVPIEDNPSTADDESATIITKAGYSTSDISKITFKKDNSNKIILSKIEIDTVNGGTEIASGKFKGATYSASGR